MTANGAAGVTLREFERVLGARLSELNDTGKLLLDAFNETSDGVTLKAVNGIWYNTAGDFEPDDDFLQANADYFNAAAVASDFSKKSTVDDINGFIRENTNGLIEKMLETLGDDAVMVLVNTLYFKGMWRDPFEPINTYDATFTLSGGGEVRTPTMAQEYGAALYFESDGAKGVILPYEGGRYAYAAILPDGGVSEYVSALTGADFSGLLQSASEQNVVLYLPKYEVKDSCELGDILKNMGLQMAFDPKRRTFRPWVRRR
jgi:serpin B